MDSLSSSEESQIQVNEIKEMLNKLAIQADNKQIVLMKNILLLPAAMS